MYLLPYMQKRGQLLKSGIQKFQILKLNCTRHLAAPVRRDTQVDENLDDSSLINSGSKHEVCTNRRYKCQLLIRGSIES